METLPIGRQLPANATNGGLSDQSRLSEQDFLMLLVAQLRNQNPMEPQSDTDFVTQLSQFDQVASLKKLNDTLTDLTSLSLLGQASGMLGREVSATLEGEEEPIVGLVESVQINGDEALLVVNGRLIPVQAVQAVRDAAADPASDGASDATTDAASDPSAGDG